MMVEILTEGPFDRVSFDYGVEFVTVGGTTIRVEGQGVVYDRGKTPRIFDTEAPAAVASTLLNFLHRPARVLLDGATLVLAVDPALELRVEPSTEFEAWSVAFSDGSRIVCTDSGQVTRWSAS